MKLTQFLPQADIIDGLSQRISNKYPDVTGRCELVAKELTGELNKRGINAKHAVGTFLLDTPDAEKYMECDDWEEQDEYNPNHDWVEVEGKILDLTAKQFKESVNENIPDIVYINFSSPLYSRYRFINYYGGI